MRHIAALLGVLSLTACDSLWRWTARCDVGDSACSTGTPSADMSIYPLADLANADLLGVEGAHGMGVLSGRLKSGRRSALRLEGINGACRQGHRRG